ncbi:hypothetical protein G9A89_018663 [Geosiphon pyriformis]|nr:hypothetical protein G9A89_018663 [Geosiphon pyriformis]
MEPVGLSADGSGLILTGLGIRLNVKKNCLDSVYSCGALQKKPRKHVVGVGIIDSSAGFLSLEDVVDIGKKPTLSWGSKVDSKASSISGLSDIENMRNMVIKKTISSGAGLSLGVKLPLSKSNSLEVSCLNDYLAALKHSLELLSDQVSDILRKLSLVELASLVPSFCASLPADPMSVALVLDSNMAVNNVLPLIVSFFSVVIDKFAGHFDQSSSKILISKMSGLESKMVALEVSVNLVLAKLDVLCLGSDIVYWYVNSGSLVFFIIETKLQSCVRFWIANKFEGVHVFTSGLDNRFFGTRMAMIMNNSLACYVFKLLVTFLGLYIGASSETRFGQALKVNFLIVKAVNSSTFVVLGGDFNENGSERNASFKFCRNLGLNLSSAVAGYQVCSVFNFFNTNHNAVLVSIGLAKFRDCTSAKLLVLADKFSGTKSCGDMDAMWTILEKTMVASADECSRNKHSSRFFGLEILVAKVVGRFSSDNMLGINCLVKVWSTLDNIKTYAFNNVLCLGVKSVIVLKHLLLVCKGYRKSKMYESRLAKEASIRKAIAECMENFCSNKSILNHLVVEDELVLEPEEMKSSMDRIMEGWTRKCTMPLYTSLVYVRNNVFSGVICAVSINELLSVVGGLPDGKATSLSALIETARKILVVASNPPVTIQFPVFVVGSVVENVLKKNRKIWLVLQDMQKTYDSCIKMCEKFIRFFGSIHENRVNRIMTDFGLSDDYKVHDDLDQGKVFSPLFWRIFYDLLLCEIKRHKHLYRYRINSKFVSKTSRIENSGGKTSYFAAGVFVDDTIWVGNCQAFTQFALDIVSEFFEINNIFINSKKTVAISINQNIKKTITDKQFSYLVLAVLQSIISYQTQFSFVLSNMCHRWNVMVRKSLKLKADLPLQSEMKVAALVSFSNAIGILGCLFGYRFLDLQVLSWASLNSLQFSVRLHVSPLSLANNLLNVFRSFGHFSILLVFEKSLYFDSVSSLRHFVIAFSDWLFDRKSGLLDWKTFYYWKRLDPCGLVPYWFMVASEYLIGLGLFLSGFVELGQSNIMDILESDEFSVVFTDGSLRRAGSASITSGAAAYFPVLDLDVGVSVYGFVSSMMAKLQAVTLFLKCVSSFNTVFVHFDSQTAINTCLAEFFSAVPDFCNPCWIERCYIFNLIREKDLNVA